MEAEGWTKWGSGSEAPWGTFDLLKHEAKLLAAETWRTPRNPSKVGTAKETFLTVLPLGIAARVPKGPQGPTKLGAMANAGKRARFFILGFHFGYLTYLRSWLTNF